MITYEYKLIRGRLYRDSSAGSRYRILSFCLDTGNVVTLPIVRVGA